MKILSKIIIILITLLNINSAQAHVSHYDKLRSIDFEIYRNNKLIGNHIFTFKKVNDELHVKSDIKFKIKKLGVVLYKYNAVGTEIFSEGNLIKFNSKTNQNGKEKYVNIKVNDNEIIIDGTSFKGNVPIDHMLGTWWNHSLVEAKAQISAVSGRIIKQKVVFLGKETININGKDIEALHFNFSSADQSLKKDKKLNTDIWYEEKTLNWVKASFKKKGNWEYRLVDIK
jgi:hypothetical protein